MHFESLKNIFDYVKRDKYSISDAEWNEQKHPRGQPENKGQFTSNQLADNIETILHGTKKEKDGLSNRYFNLTETPEEFKEVGLKGDKINIRYGVISRHKDKNEQHRFSSDEWRTICKNLSDPKKCIITQSAGRKDFNIYTKIGSSVMVGVEIKYPAKDKASNNLKTVYRKEPKNTETVLYPKDLKEITPAQQSLLTGLHSSTYTADKRSIIIIDINPELVKSIFTMLKTIRGAQ